MPELPLKSHFARYPLMQPQDAIKLCYQAAFGAGHLVADPAGCLARLLEEAAALPPKRPLQQALPQAQYEEIGGGMCRVNLRGLAGVRGGNCTGARALWRLFLLGANETPRNAAREAFFAEALLAAERLAARGEAPFGLEEWSAALRRYRADGCPAVSHSARYREAYAPAYRVLPAHIARLLPLCVEIERQLADGAPVVIGIDGSCGGGKSTLAARLKEAYGLPVIAMDDFFLPPDLRDAARLSQPGGNIHYERFLAEVAAPLRAGRPALYRRFGCGRMAYEAAWRQAAAPVIIEGSYSLHPAFTGLYSLRVFLGCGARLQRQRLQLREGGRMLARFEEEWIPMEAAYFAAFRVREGCDVLLCAEELAE